MSMVEIMDSELDAMRAETLREMGETPESSQQSATPTRAASPSLPTATAWEPRGSVETGIGDTDKTILILRFITTTKPGEAIYQMASERIEQARAEMVAAMQTEFGNFLEAAAECRIIEGRLRCLDTRAAELEAERARCMARPKGKGGELVRIQQEREHTEAEQQAAKLEFQAMKAVRETALHEAKRKADALAKQIARQCEEQHAENMHRELEHFCAAHAEELTRLAALEQARKASGYLRLLSTLSSFVHQQLEAGELLGKASHEIA